MKNCGDIWGQRSRHLARQKESEAQEERLFAGAIMLIAPNINAGSTCKTEPAKDIT